MGESGEMRRARKAAVLEDDRQTANTVADVEAAQAAVQEASRLLAEAEQRANAATAKAEEEKQTRLRDWATLTLATSEKDQQEARSALDKARAAFRKAAPTGEAGSAYLNMVRALVALSSLHQRAQNAASRLGLEVPYVPERSLQIPTYADAMNQALAAHAAGIQADAQDALSAEIQAVEAGT